MVANKETTVVKDYMRYHESYSKKFGKDRTLVLMQVGKFYEAYSTNFIGPDLFKLEEITDAEVARKGTNVSLKYPYMWGFPLQSAEKYMPMLIESGYHLVVFEQTTPPPNPKRELVGIYSPATYIESINRPASNFILHLVLEEIVQKNAKPICMVGMSATDISTGEVFVHESFSDMDDESYGLDEAIRFINGLNPKEIIIDKENLIKLTEKHVIEYLDLKGKFYQFRDYNPTLSKLAYQRKLFELIYSEYKGIAGILDSLGISKSIYARKSLTALMTYLSDHYEKLIVGIKHPEFYLSNSFLILGNDAINQLNIVNNDFSTTNSKVNNLMDVIDVAATHMGKRFVKLRMVSPLTDPNELTKIYNIVDYVLRKGIYIKLEPDLKAISDIERLERKMSLAMINPSEIATFIRSFEHVLNLFNTIKTKNYLTKYIRTSHLRKKIAVMNQKLTDTFDYEKCKNFTNRHDITENIFKTGVYPDIDKMENDIGMGESLMEELQRRLSDMIIETNSNTKVHLKNNKNEGYYFQITKKRYEKLKAILDSTDTIDMQGHTINVSDLEYKETKYNVKITAPFLKTNTDNIDELLEEIKNTVYEHYIENIKEIHETYSEIIKECVAIVTAIDYYYCIAKVSRINNYCKPTIRTNDARVDQHESFIQAESLRHPIVEKIIDHEYIPHDISIGADLKGMMIYGLNAAGKSVLMKAIGMAVIMAQAGFFVPARKFEYYPYKALYTRITGGDDMIRGLSSFSLEMVELNAILKRADVSTLVIGDEVCRGTEHISGNAIVAATLIKLASLNSTFVFATHLHELMGLEQIQSIDTIRAFHLSVDFNENTDYLVYDRTLKPGTGERIYGIIVAKSIIKNSEFINKALEIKNILLDNDPKLSVLPNKRSRYHAELIVDRCKLCGKKNSHMSPTPLEVHHINAQADCVDGFVKSKPHLKKNHISNLIEVCQACHDAVHNDTIVIEGYRMTSKGRQIMYRRADDPDHTISNHTPTENLTDSDRVPSHSAISTSADSARNNDWETISVDDAKSQSQPSGKSNRNVTSKASTTRVKPTTKPRSLKPKQDARKNTINII